jgi:hypothetical protein
MGSLAGLAGPLGLDPADWVGGGAADGPGVVAAQVDGDGVLGDVGGDGLPGVDAAEGDLLADDHDHAGVAGPALDGDRLCGRARGRPGGAGAAQQPGLVPGQRWPAATRQPAPVPRVKRRLAGGRPDGEGQARARAANVY